VSNTTLNVCGGVHIFVYFETSLKINIISLNAIVFFIFFNRQHTNFYLGNGLNIGYM
jgi:hypothetical protein